MIEDPVNDIARDEAGNVTVSSKVEQASHSNCRLTVNSQTAKNFTSLCYRQNSENSIHVGGNL